MSFAKIIPFILIISLFTHCTDNDPNKNLLEAPEKWKGEIIEFPLEFAPSLSYSGIEYVRFAPDWGKKGASDHFSYAFLWDINENPQLSSKKIESEMETYFDGLMNTVSKESDLSNKEIPKAKAFFEKVNDSVFIGKILTYDAFITKDKISLNCIVNYHYCNNTSTHQVLFNLSPQPLEHPIWKRLKQIKTNTVCK
ncbi:MULTISPECIES: hypothetical protein [Aquimarina]|uniref:hypothetical protein n=1 Tax=Aquimarina TaxID=290174 RepID=UPI000CDF0248|nr:MULTISPECIES: hypothetical protein [Aquimarina]